MPTDRAMLRVQCFGHRLQADIGITEDSGRHRRTADETGLKPAFSTTFAEMQSYTPGAWIEPGCPMSSRKRVDFDMEALF